MRVLAVVTAVLSPAGLVDGAAHAGPAWAPPAQSAATMRWAQDTPPPTISVTIGSRDRRTPGQPVVATRDVPLRLDSGDPDASFECTDNGAPVACTGGAWTLPAATSGRHVFTARAVGTAGNASAWAPPVEFFVPRNLDRQNGWRTLHNRAWFDGDAVVTTTPGAKLVLPRTATGELRLYAATGPRMGTVAVRVGRTSHHVDLRGPVRAVKEIVLTERHTGTRKQRVVIENVTSDRIVLDAIVARPTPLTPSPVERAVADLATRLGVDPGAVELVSRERVLWGDTSIGCGQPGMAYAQIVSEGLRIVLRVDGREFEYHSREHGRPFYCAEPTQ